MASSPDVRGPLHGRRILTTRPTVAAHVQRDRFRELGADAVALPCLKLEGLQDPQAFDQIVGSLREYDGVILSSRAGVEAFTQSLSRLGLDAQLLGGRTLVAVGRATASACVSAELTPDIIPAQPSSEGIAQALAERSVLGGRWLHVRARDGRGTLDDAISAAGGRYQLAVGYRAERPQPPPGVIEWVRGGVDVICLHSGRTGQHLRDTLDEALPDRSDDIVRSACIVSAGPITTQALQEQGFEVAATAGSPGDDGMVRAVSELLRGPPDTQSHA